MNEERKPGVLLPGLAFLERNANSHDENTEVFARDYLQAWFADFSVT